MSRVVCFGEALIDFLNKGQQLDGELMLISFTQYPGGAPANAAVAVARLGGRAAFAGQVGDDAFGHFLLRALRRYGSFFQDTGGKWIFVVTPDGKSAVRRDVRLGRRNTRFIEVIEGLEAGEQVITSHYSGFRDMDRLILNDASNN